MLSQYTSFNSREEYPLVELLHFQPFKELHQSGIYKLRCQGNDRFYVGSSKLIYKRLLHHRSDLLNNSHANKHLQRSSNRYKINSIYFSIIEHCEREELLYRELTCIKLLKPHFNIILPIVPHKNNPDTQEYVELITKTHNKAVHQVDIKTRETLNIFPSIKAAQEFLNVKESHISEVCNGTRQSSNGYYWILVENINKINLKEIEIRVCKRPVHQIDPITKNIIATYASIIEAEKATGASNPNITKVCKGNSDLYITGGYIWKYADEDPKDIRVSANKKHVLQIDIATNKVIRKFESAVEVENLLGISKRKIREICNGNQKSQESYTWKWELRGF